MLSHHLRDASALESLNATDASISQEQLADISIAFEGMNPDAYIDTIDDSIEFIQNVKETISNTRTVSTQLLEFMKTSAPTIEMTVPTLASCEKDTALSDKEVQQISNEIDQLTETMNSDLDDKTVEYANYVAQTASVDESNEAAGAIAKMVYASIAYSIGDSIVWREILVSKMPKQKELASMINALSGTEKTINALANLSAENHLNLNEVEKAIKPSSDMDLYVAKKKIGNSAKIQSRSITRVYDNNLKALGYTAENVKSMDKELANQTNNAEKIQNTYEKAVESLQSRISEIEGKMKDASKEEKKQYKAELRGYRMGLRNMKFVYDKYSSKLKFAVKSMKKIQQKIKKVNKKEGKPDDDE